MKQRPCWCSKPVLWELNSFQMQTLSFVPINLHRCWPREWKRSIRPIKFNSASVLQWFLLSTLMKSINYWPRVLVSFAVLPRRLPSAWASCLNPWTGFLKSVFVVLVFFPSLYPFGHFCWLWFPLFISLLTLLKLPPPVPFWPPILPFPTPFSSKRPETTPCVSKTCLLLQPNLLQIFVNWN